MPGRRVDSASVGLMAIVVAALVALVTGLQHAQPARAAAVPDTDTSGIVTSVSASSLSLRSKKGKTKTFRLDANTTYAKLDDDVTLADVTVGSLVKVDFAPGPNGSRATKVTIGVATSGGWYFTTHVEGTVDSVSSTAIAVHKAGSDKIVTVRTTAATSVERIGTRVEAGALARGTLVLAEYTIEPNGTLDATSVEVGVKATSGTIVYHDKHKGKVVSRDGTTVVLDLKGLPPTPFPLVGSSQIERLGHSATAGVLAPGAIVKVDFALDGAGVLTIGKINVGVTTPFGNLFSTKQEGRVNSFSGSTLRLWTTDGDDLAFRLRKATQVLVNGLPVSEGRLRPGTPAKVTFAIAGRTLLANEIKLGVARGNELVFPKRKTGVVVRITATTIVLRTPTGLDPIRLTPKTAYRRAGKPVRRTALHPKDRVSVVYDPAGPGTKIALTIFALTR